jgi:tetratricopeptide (TPR) repeat protein
MTGVETIANRYRVRSAIGRGGMGEVVRCWDTVMRREVALKRVLHDSGRMPADELDRLFYREAAALASVSHPNVVSAKDFGALVDGARYLVMDLVEGLSLNDVWRDLAVLSWDLLALVIDQVLAGLAHLHARGILHRDLKPANVMLSDEDGMLRVIIVDLGLAFFASEALWELQISPPEDLFDHVARYVTPPYCAPEQLLSQAALQGPPSDLHGTGVLLHQFCCGSLPYGGRSEREQLRAIARDAPRAFRPQNQAPAQVAAIVERLLAKHPCDRYQCAADVRTALRGLWDPLEAHGQWRALFKRFVGRARESTSARLAARAGAGRAAEPEDSSADLVLAEVRPSDLLGMQLPALVGRQREQSIIWELVEGVLAGKRRCIVLEGEPGVGKSRLSQWALEQVHERGVMATLRASHGSAGGLSQGILGGLDRLFGFGSAPRHRIRSALAVCWRREPDGAQLAAILSTMLRPGDVHIDSETRIATLQKVLALLARGRPLLLWVDDLPRVDAETVRCIERLLEGDGRVLIVATARTQELRQRSDVDAWVERLITRQLAVRHVLQPLERESVDELFSSLLRVDMDPRAVRLKKKERDVTAVLHQASLGNPLFALQQVHAWKEAGQLCWDADAACFRVDSSTLLQAAETTSRLWQARLERLAPAMRRAALAATTLGSLFSSELLIALLDRLGLSGAHVAAYLLEERLLVPDVNHLGWYHDTLEEYLRSELMALADSRDLHRCALEVLRAQPEASGRAITLLIARNLIALGHHAEAATTVLDMVLGRYRDTQDTVHAVEDLQLIETVVPAARLHEFHLMRGRARLVAGFHDEARQDAWASISLARAEGRALLVARGAELLGEVEKGEGNYERAAYWIRQALDRYRLLDDGEGVARTCLLLSHGLIYMSAYDDAERWVRIAMQQARQHELAPVLGECALWLASLLHDRGRYSEAISWATQACESANKAGDNAGEGRACFLVATIYGQQAASKKDEMLMARAREHRERASVCFAKAADWSGPLYCELLGGWMACVEQDYALAQKRSALVREHYLQTASTHEVVSTWLVSAAASLCVGNRAAARAALDEVVALDPPEPMLLQTWALLEFWWEGRTSAQAATHLARALEIAERLGITSWGVPWILGCLLALDLRAEHRRALSAWLERLARA